MQYSRQEIVDLLRKAGFREEADKAAEELPDPVDFAEVERWAAEYGITKDMLISQFGGSP